MLVLLVLLFMLIFLGSPSFVGSHIFPYFSVHLLLLNFFIFLIILVLLLLVVPLVILVAQVIDFSRYLVPQVFTLVLLVT